MNHEFLTQTSSYLQVMVGDICIYINYKITYSILYLYKLYNYTYIYTYYTFTAIISGLACLTLQLPKMWHKKTSSKAPSGISHLPTIF